MSDWSTTEDILFNSWNTINIYILHIVLRQYSTQILLRQHYTLQYSVAWFIWYFWNNLHSLIIKCLLWCPLKHHNIKFYGRSSRNVEYHIYPAIRRSVWLQITKSVLWNFTTIPILPFLNNHKDLDRSYKMDLDLWDCFGRKKTLSYNRRNTVGTR